MFHASRGGYIFVEDSIVTRNANEHIQPAYYETTNMHRYSSCVILTIAFGPLQIVYVVEQIRYRCVTFSYNLYSI